MEPCGSISHVMENLLYVLSTLKTCFVMRTKCVFCGPSCTVPQGSGCFSELFCKMLNSLFAGCLRMNYVAFVLLAIYMGDGVYLHIAVLKILEDEELYWLKNHMNLCCTEGDNNTEYFHSSTLFLPANGWRRKKYNHEVFL